MNPNDPIPYELSPEDQAANEEWFASLPDPDVPEVAPLIPELPDVPLPDFVPEEILRATGPTVEVTRYNVTEVKLGFTGRGFQSARTTITAEQDGVLFRFDDDRNEESWAELFLPRATLCELLEQVAALQELRATPLLSMLYSVRQLFKK